MNREQDKGMQSIGCTVTSCRHNCMGSHCELDRIEVRPCRGGSCGSGRPDDESSCGSYRTR